MYKISVCIPVYKMKNNLCERFLVENLSHLLNQTFKNFEVIVSDQSSDDNLEKISNIFKYCLNIKHIKNSSEVKNAANNVNNAIKNASGEIVKILFVDDFFVDSLALQKINDAFDSNPNKKWLIAGFTHCDENKTSYNNYRYPRYDQHHVLGDNSTGNPSNYSIRRNCALEMDENLYWIVDGEYFYRSFYHYGNPIMINDILICMRTHQDSKFLDPKFRELNIKERQYCIDKFSKFVEHKLI